MASNQFGQIFRITTWGESHGKAVGVVIDGCPAGLEISEEEIQAELIKRAPGRSPFTSPRKEPDSAEILSGVFEGKTTGTPISIMIPNRDVDSSKYEATKHLLKPGHANFTYLQKYGVFDYRGGGRASARETVCRVAAGAVAKKLLKHFGIHIVAFIKQIGGIEAEVDYCKDPMMQKAVVDQSNLFCPDTFAAEKFAELIENAREEGDSLGGVVEFCVYSIPAGLGDPVYEKLEANLAKAMLTLPATKGFEIGSGFQAASMAGSEHNDRFFVHENSIQTATNRAGGVLGGISTGMPLMGRIAFKPPSSIMKRQETLDFQGNVSHFQLPEGSRHDPCVAIRAVPVVEAMAALVVADSLLLNRSAKL